MLGNISGKLHAFSNCRNMRLNVTFTDKSVFEEQKGNILITYRILHHIVIVFSLTLSLPTSHIGSVDSGFNFDNSDL